MSNVISRYVKMLQIVQKKMKNITIVFMIVWTIVNMKNITIVMMIVWTIVTRERYSKSWLL